MFHSKSESFRTGRLVAGFGLVVALSAPVHAAEPLGAGLGLDWWGDPYQAGFTDPTAGEASFNGFTEIWLSEAWGVRGARYESSLQDFGLENSDHTSIDFKRRFFSLSEDSFVSLGAGWESIGLQTGESSSGLRLTAGGRVGLGESFSLYGHTSWLPELGDVGARSNLEGQEFEAGVSFEPAPFVSVRLGFRRFKLDFDEDGSSGSAESDGFILGAGFHW